MSDHDHEPGEDPLEDFVDAVSEADALRSEVSRLTGDIRQLLGFRETDKERIRLLERHLLSLGIYAHDGLEGVRLDRVEDAFAEVDRLKERD